MAKKFIAGFLIAAMAISVLFCLSACSEKQLKIVFLGDSIAEAILGPSPLSERENYGYYALVGKRNRFEYVNRSVSGHKSAQLLDLISQETEDARMTVTHIKTADIIQVSILGNDMLQSGLSELLVEYAREKHGEIAKDDTYREEILRSSRITFAKIIAKLKELNPEAILFIQTVYNPVYDGSPIANASARSILTSEPYNYSEADLRVLGGELLATLNDVVFSYHAENPNDFYIVDVCKAFGEIYDADPVRGKNLIYPDGIHPSNEGHAVIADATQSLLETLGLAKKSSSLISYKKLRLEQIKRLYPDVDYYDAKREINDAKSTAEVTEIYFRLTDGLVPALA